MDERRRSITRRGIVGGAIGATVVGPAIAQDANHQAHMNSELSG